MSYLEMSYMIETCQFVFHAHEFQHYFHTHEMHCSRPCSTINTYTLIFSKIVHVHVLLGDDSRK